MTLSNNLTKAIKAALNAGEVIMEIYQSGDFSLVFKNDLSPLTKADTAAHKTIKKSLGTYLPILSEEGFNLDYSERKNWSKFWMVDPIDGTKEFIKRNGEFTINIALIENQTPVIGVVYVPAKYVLYFAEKNLGSFKINGIKSLEDLKNSEIIDLSKSIYPKCYTIVVSKSHMNEETQKYVDKKEKDYGKIICQSYGSSLKICKVADGSAHCYPRFGPTMEWDTAAAHAIAVFSNCTISDSNSKSEVIYNKENLTNPFFVVENE